MADAPRPQPDTIPSAELEKFDVQANLEGLDRFHQPFTDVSISQIKTVGDCIFCFRRKNQLPMIYGPSTSQPLSLQQPVRIGRSLGVQSNRQFPSEIDWRVNSSFEGAPYDLRFRGPFYSDAFDYTDPAKTQWLPAIAPRLSDNAGIYTILREDNGNIVFVLMIKDSIFSASGGSYESVQNRINAGGVLEYIIQPDGACSLRLACEEGNTVRSNYFGTLGIEKKRDERISAGGVHAVLEFGQDAGIYSEGILRLFNAQDHKETEKITASDFCPNPANPNEFFAVSGKKVYRFKMKDGKIESREEFKLPPAIDCVLDFQCDPRGNFAAVLNWDSRKKSGKIYMINLATGEIAWELQNDKIDCAPPLTFTESGHIIFQEVTKEKVGDSEVNSFRMRSIRTNVSLMRKGEAKEAKKKEEDIARRVREGLVATGIDQVLASLTPQQRREVKGGRSAEVVATEAALERQLGEFVAGILAKQGIASAEIKDALDRVITLSRQADYAMFAAIFKQYVVQLQGAFERLRSAEIAGEIGEIAADASGVDVGRMNGGAVEVCRRMGEQFTRIEALLRETGGFSEQYRTAMPAELLEQRGRVKQTLEALRSKTLGELAARIDAMLGDLKQLLATIDDSFVLESAWKGDLVRLINEDISSLPDTGRQLEYAEKLKAVFDERRAAVSAIEGRARIEKEENYRRLEKKAALELEEIRTQLAALPDENEIQAFKLTSPTVAGFNRTLDALPPERANLMRVQMEDVFAHAVSSLEARKSVREFEGNVVSFGRVKFPRFQPETRTDKEEWKLAPTLTLRGEIMLELKSTHGRQRALPDEVVLDAERPLILDRAEYQRLMRDANSYLNTFIQDHSELIPGPEKRNVPEASATWEYTEHVERNLEEFAESLAIQKRNQEGIVILEGEAGTGKNVLIDIFAHHTNREVFTFTCNSNSSKEDMTRFYEYDPQKGTYRLNSLVVEAIMTPGAILVLDEINTLLPAVAKMLNTLLDYRRTLYPTEGGKFGRKAGFKADKEVLIVGTMNPQNYAGVQKLSPEVVSRSSIVRVEYPPMQDAAGKYKVDEALMYRKYISQLAAFTRQQFIAMWHAVINGGDRKSVDALLTPEIEDILRALKIVVVTANKFRKAYMDYKMGTSVDEMDFVFSLREGVNIAQRYAFNGGDIKNSIRKVVLPKIWDEQQRARVSAAIIDQV